MARRNRSMCAGCRRKRSNDTRNAILTGGAWLFGPKQIADAVAPYPCTCPKRKARWRK